VNKAYKMFDDEEQLQYVMGVAEEAKELLEQKLDEKRKQAKKEGKTSIDEDDPETVRRETYFMYEGGENKQCLSL